MTQAIYSDAMIEALRASKQRIRDKRRMEARGPNRDAQRVGLQPVEEPIEDIIELNNEQDFVDG